MKNKFFKIITFIFLVVNIFFYPIKINAQDKSILFISSYSPGFTSFNDQIKGLSDELNSKYDLQIEYMDGKKFKSEQSEETFYNLLKFKIKNYKKFDAIILGDDMALNFGLKYKDSLFDDVPIVFFGVSEESNIKKAKELNISGGVIESPSISENLDLINTLYPKNSKEKRNLVLITGDAKRYKKEINEFYSFKDSYKQFNFKYLPMPSEVNNDFLNDLLKLNSDKDIVFFLYPYRDGAGKSISVEKSIDVINENIKAPIFTNLSYDIYKNMIGGKVINHYEQGKEAAKLINDILSNKISLPKFINNNEANIWMFNYDNLKKNNISLNSIPKESIIINKPTPFLIKYKGLILPVSFTILGFILIIIALLIKSIRHKKYQDELMRAKQLAEDANNTKSNFISNISHELRTPVAVISSSNQLLRKINNNTNNNIDNTLDIIDQNANRLIRLINNIIDIAKIDSGFGDLNLKNIDVITLIEDTVLSVIPYAISKELEIVFDTNTEELIMAVDSEKIERIVLNLLSNAIKFSKSNSKILANIVVKDKLLIFIVKDFGIGIDDKNLSKIFDKFTQIDDSFTKYNEGSGIGLSIVKSFVDLHEGTISVDSKINKGSTFKVSIPIKIIEEFNTVSGDNLSNVNIELSDIIR
ncbi:HAMP domain-containing sensor histidine kinase [Clostridium sp. CCUG 7971]|uniref:sensor histidine kinase n=1 Tax=Clostridium sp. CCUG 7971 TaxID=2811414 RepID=UPI001ABAB11E|nr:HAMP domain-containing sensor histidine kinase [Clostridium sp. CCUG 7971]MBO3444264.1 HAMP domain-containing histidine kinase [Clostridium sp. CCUG 7971]